MDTAQTALRAFLDARLKDTFVWTTLTAAEKLAHVVAKEGLQIAADKEAEANRIENEKQVADAQLTAKNNLIALLKARGYLCDNSQADWYKLFNHPTIFGKNWKVIADYHISQSTGTDYFLQKIINYLNHG
jgi:hypothetical protein